LVVARLVVAAPVGDGDTMATLVERYFSKADLDAVTEAVRKAELKSSGELAVQLASRSHRWMLERIIDAALFGIACFIVALFLARPDWGMYYNVSQGLLYGVIGFAVGWFVWPLLLKSERRRNRIVWKRALKLFSQLTPTRGHTGVLIFMSLEENQVALVADKGIAEKVAPGYWDAQHAVIAKAMKAGNHAEGLIQALNEIGDELGRHFPRQADDINELPDAPTILDK
jgi:putative membrane protein